MLTVSDPEKGRGMEWILGVDGEFAENVNNAYKNEMNITLNKGLFLLAISISFPSSIWCFIAVKIWGSMLDQGLKKA